jgi:hypothetical protein
MATISKVSSSSLFTRGRLASVMGVGVALVFMGASIKSEASLVVAVTGGFIALAGASVEMFTYLQETRRRFLKDRAFIESQHERVRSSIVFQAEVEKLQVEIKSMKDAIGKDLSGGREFLTPEQIKNLTEKLAKQAEEAIKKGAVADVLKRVSSETQEQHIRGVRELIQGIQERLEDEVSALGSRANVNLIIGNAISFFGLAVLGYFVFTFPTQMLASGTTTEIVVYFLSRFSLVAFIEIFAYFFLRLYRYSIFEIKYFQNELTNAQFRAMSLEAALLSGDTTTIKAICIDLSKTERNFLLKKGDTTLGLRTMESEQGQDKMVVEILERVMKQWPKGRGTNGQHHADDEKPKQHI